MNNEKELQKAQFDAILAYIDANFSDPTLCIDQLCEKFGIMPYMVKARFREYANGSFRKYVIDLRMQAAKETLLHSDTSVNDVAVQTGFSSASYFIRAFKRYYGITPSKYREENGLV